MFGRSNPAIAGSGDRDTAAPVPSPQVPVSPPPAAADPAREIIGLVRGDLLHTVRAVADANLELRANLKDEAELIVGIEQASRTVQTRADEARANVASLHAGLMELTEAGAEIRARSQQSHSLVTLVADRTEQVSRGLDRLKSSTNDIGNVVRLIARIASQTNLLALNATIEAARAGDAGRGFAVVAHEVKTLAAETRKATENIAGKIEQLAAAAAASIEAISAISRTIEEVKPSFSHLASAIERQSSSTEAIEYSAAQAANVVNEAATAASSLGATAASASRISERVTGVTGAALQTIDRLRDHCVVLLAQSNDGTRRVLDRLPLMLRGRLRSEDNCVGFVTVDISEELVLLKPAEPVSLRPGQRLTVEFEDGIGALMARHIESTVLGLSIQLDASDTAAKERLRARLVAGSEELARETANLIEAVQGRARIIEQTFEQLLAQGRLNQDDLFDSDYQPIAGTDPQQYRNRALAVLEEALPPIQEPVLAFDPRILTCVTVDRNGYLPVHNAAVSKPQRPGDPVWNAANARNRRMFDDRAGLLAARNLRPFLLQSYPRNMGGGQFVMVAEVDAPIRVRGLHWGALRIAFRLPGHA